MITFIYFSLVYSIFTSLQFKRTKYVRKIVYSLLKVTSELKIINKKSRYNLIYNYFWFAYNLIGRVSGVNEEYIICFECFSLNGKVYIVVCQLARSVRPRHEAQRVERGLQLGGCAHKHRDLWCVFRLT